MARAHLDGQEAGAVGNEPAAEDRRIGGGSIRRGRCAHQAQDRRRRQDTLRQERMKPLKSIVLSGALVACAASAAPTSEAPKPLSFVASAKVEVDADGKLVKVEASPDL